MSVESQLIDSLYSQDENFENKILREKNPPKKIHDFYKKINLTGSYLSLISSIASKSFDMIVIDVEVFDKKGFFIHYRIDSSNIFSKRVLFSQYVKIT